MSELTEMEQAKATIATQDALLREVCDLLITIQVDPEANVPTWFRLKMSAFLVQAAHVAQVVAE